MFTERKLLLHRFPGLKPPRPPTPSPPASKSEQVYEPKVTELTEQKDESILPVENTKEDKESITGSIEDIEARKLLTREIATREEEALAKALEATSFVWPWQKPKPLEEEKEKVAPSPSPSPSENVTDILPSCSRPLSPYTQYVLSSENNFLHSWKRRLSMHVYVTWPSLFPLKSN